MTSPQFLEKLAAYVPMPVAQTIYHQPQPLTGPKSCRYPAAVLFADISGFTRLSEVLSRTGPTGAEELTQLINQYFTRMIRIVQDYHGQVVKFSGDAMTIIFPLEDFELGRSDSLAVAVRRAGECALEMQAKMSHFADIKISQGRASLSMKAGIGVGEILECSIGGALGRWEYVIGGHPLVQVGAAEHHARPGQIVASAQAWAIARHFFNGVPTDDGFVVLDRALEVLPKVPSTSLDWSKIPPEQRPLAEKAMLCYIPGAIKARLDEQAEWLAELRRITVLFIGIGGFDYESREIAPRLQNFLQAAQEVTYRFEGSLGKIAIDDKGTVMLILFGAPPFFHEDDATRAVACALGLQVVAQERHLRMSIGITEGSIFAGPVGAPNHREYTVIGNTVNLAARLMEYGRGGSIIVSQRVKAKAGSRFVVEDLGNLSLRGNSVPTPAYLVTGERGVQDEIFNRYLLHDDPLVGRKAELEQMRRIEAKVRKGNFQLLFIEADLGLGKSRLAAELVREWMMEGGVGYGSKCVSYGQQVPYQGWREILVAIFGLTPSSSTEQKIAHLVTGLKELVTPSEQPDYWLERLPLLGDILGMNVPESPFTRHLSAELRRDNTFALVEAILRHQAGRHPLLILLEDIQWADDLSLSLAAYLTQNLIGSPIFMGLLYRPDANLQDLAPALDFPYAHTMRLHPLSDQESLDLVRILLKGRSVPPEVEEVILSKGQGNLFFLQEITNRILDVIDNHKKQTDNLLETLNLPDTLQEVILARFDRLSEAEKLTLKIASVIGTHFQRLLLSEVHPMINAQLRLSEQLDRLEHENLVRLEQPAPKWEYVFHSVIAQEVVYEGLLLAQRRQLHSIVAEALENIAPDEVEQLAFHYKRSDNWQKALEYLRIASQRARRENANNAAIGYYSEILVCLQNLSTNIVTTEYWDTLLERAKLYNLIGWRDEELEDLGTLGIMAEALNDKTRRALAARQWARLYETSGDYTSALEINARFISLAQAIDNERLLGEGYNYQGRLLYLCDQYEPAVDYLQQAFDIAERTQDEIAKAECLNNHGLVAHYQAKYDTALQDFLDAINLWQKLDRKLELGHSLSNLGEVYYDMGRYTLAHQTYKRALSLHKSMGDRAGMALARYGLGKVERGLGNFTQSKRYLEQALTFYQSIGDRHMEGRCLSDLGLLYCRLENYNTAGIYLDEAITILRDLNAPWWTIVRTLIFFAWALHDQGHFEEAQIYITEALDIERDTQRQVALVEDMLHLGRIALALDNLDQAERWIQHVVYYLDRQGVQGIEHPAFVYLNCYHILHGAGHKDQANQLLLQGYRFVIRQAQQINDESSRKSYLTNIPEHRQLKVLATKPAKIS
ncbi:MAG: tetratricopeptide repeat protein [Anaerolineae bacterium]|nr:tetratricopeptide repeat protein [Anaerolineae bacterium]